MITLFILAYTIPISHVCLPPGARQDSAGPSARGALEKVRPFHQNLLSFMLPSIMHFEPWHSYPYPRQRQFVEQDVHNRWAQQKVCRPVFGVGMDMNVTAHMPLGEWGSRPLLERKALENRPLPLKKRTRARLEVTQTVLRRTINPVREQFVKGSRSLWSVPESFVTLVIDVWQFRVHESFVNAVCQRFVMFANGGVRERCLRSPQ